MITFLITLAAQALLLNQPEHKSPYAAWPRGPSTDPAFFPIAVWVQQPRNAQAYQAAGINTYVGLWNGPTAEQLDALEAAGMKVVCSQNRLALERLSSATIIGWMHDDEPDNAQPAQTGGYGPPIPPQSVVERYRAIRAADPSRPVLLNLGQGVAWDDWHGRGVRSQHPEDYPEYLKGCDIASFDIYPVVHDRAPVKGNLWYVAHGVQRLRNWTTNKQIVWNCIEASRIDNPNVKPTPAQIKAEVWMSLIHGSTGIIYFVHQFKPNFVEASLLQDPELLAGVTAINRQIHELAPVLNSPTLADAVHVEISNPNAPVATMVKRHAGSLYLFAVALRDAPVSATFAFPQFHPLKTTQVLGESREIHLQNGQFSDSFAPYGVHLYRIR